MVGLLWVFGSMLLVMLIMYFLPLRLTKKGKIIVVLAGFLLTLGGLAAATFFSMWQTLIMLVVLILSAAYILDKQLGSSLYVTSESYHEDYETDDVQTSHIEKTTDLPRTDATTAEIPLVSANLAKETEISMPQNEIKPTEETELTDIPSVDEDISFLLNRSPSVEEKEHTKSEDSGDKNDYLSEIEKWLDDESDKDKVEIPELLFNEIPVINFDGQPPAEKNKPAAKAAEQTAAMEEIPVLSFPEKGGKDH